MRAAPLTDAALTPYHAITTELRHLRPGSSVVVIGVGGLGHVAVQLLRELSSARIVAIDISEDARRLALGAGAHAALDATGLEPGDVRVETGAAGAALVLDFVGSDSTLRLAASIVAIGGHVSVRRPRRRSLSRSGSGACRSRCPRAGHRGARCPSCTRSSRSLARVCSRSRPSGSGLDEAVEGYRRLRDGSVVGRAVVVP